MEKERDELFELDSVSPDSQKPVEPAPAVAPEQTQIPAAVKKPVKLSPAKARSPAENAKTDDASSSSNNAESPLREAPKNVLSALDLSENNLDKNLQAAVDTSSHCVLKSSPRGESPGQIFLEARTRLKIGIDQVSHKTRISKQFIESIERDDYSSLPAPVFVTAYIKALCEYYGISEKQSQILQSLGTTEKFRPVPDEIIESIHRGRQVNQEAEKKLSIMLTVVGITLLILITLSAYFVSRQMKKNEASSAPPANSGTEAGAPAKPNPLLSSESYKAHSEDIKIKFTYPQFINQHELTIKTSEEKK